MESAGLHSREEGNMLLPLCFCLSLWKDTGHVLKAVEEVVIKTNGANADTIQSA